MAVIRIWRFWILEKITSVSLAILTVTIIILESIFYNVPSLDGTSFMLVLNRLRIINSLAYISAIASLWAVGKYQDAAKRSLKRKGFTSEDIDSLLKEEKEKGRDAALQKLANEQEYVRQVVKKNFGIDPRDMIPTIGQGPISWEDIVNHVFRVLEFDRNDTVIEQNDQLKAKNDFEPYGYLLAESPILNNKVKLPIIHRDDFLCVAKVFDDQTLNRKIFKEKIFELLVVYAPKHQSREGLSLSSHHVLHYLITSYGTLDTYYSMDNDVHMAWPYPQKLFGSFIYNGEIKVEIKPEIKL